MAEKDRLSASVLLTLLLVTASVCTYTILVYRALGRTSPLNLPARIHVSVRGEDFTAKEAWGVEEGRVDVERVTNPSRPAWAMRAWGGSQASTRDHQRQESSSNNAAGDGLAIVSAAGDASNAYSPAPRQARKESYNNLGTRHHNFSIRTTPTSPRGVISVGPWGGSGGKPFYMSGESVPRLHSITLHYTNTTFYYATAIRGFSYDYFEAGVKRTTGLLGRTYGPTDPYESHATITLAADEHLTSVEGTFGHGAGVLQTTITMLTFRTDMGRTYGPYGNKTGTPFSIPAMNSCIVGFWGRSGNLLDAIGVYIRPCPRCKPPSPGTNTEPDLLEYSPYDDT